MREISDKLCNSEVPELSIPEEIVLHFVQLIFRVWVLWGVRLVLWVSLDALVSIDGELRP